MAVLFFDGCGEYYTTSEGHRVWHSFPNTTVQPTSGRRGGAALQMTAATHHAGRGFASSQTVYIGFAFQIDVLPGTNAAVMRLYGEGQEHVRLVATPSGSLLIENSFVGADLIETAPGAISAGVFSYIEVGITISDTVGVAEIRVDGVSLASGTGLDTRNGGTSDTVDAMYLFGSSGRTMLYDDVYVADNTGSAPQNTFLGDIRVDAVVPDGDGATSAFGTTFPASPTTHYTKVDESTPNDDTDYNEDSTPGNVDLFNYAAVPTISGGSTVMSVKVAACAKKTDAGIAKLRLVARPTSTNFNGADQGLSTDYKYLMQLWDTDPQAAAAWTDATINAAQFGVEVR